MMPTERILSLRLRLARAVEQSKRTADPHAVSVALADTLDAILGELELLWDDVAELNKNVYGRSTR